MRFLVLITSAYLQSRNLGTGRPKLVCTACGEYDHWRKDCPYDCHCDNCDSDSHATHMCRAPPKPSPTPSPQPVICINCGSSEHRSMECRNHPQDNREEGHVPSPAYSGYSRDKPQHLPQHLVKVHKSLMLGPGIVTNLGTTRRDLGQADNNSNSHNAPHRANQIITKIVFLTGIIGTVINRDKHDSTKSRIKCILRITLPLPLHSLQALTYLVILSCSLQKCNPVHSRFLQHNKNLKLMFIKS